MMATEERATRVEPDGRVLYQWEQSHIEALTDNLSAHTRDTVRKSIQRTLDQGRELDRLQTEFRELAAKIDAIETPCYQRDVEITHMVECEWHGLGWQEQRLTGRIDALRSMLGELP